MSEATLQSVEQAARHGRAVARAAVQAGLINPDRVRPLFQEYGMFVQAGVRGTFTQLLHARQVIDDAGVRLLEAHAPLTATPPDPADTRSDTRSGDRSGSDSRSDAGSRSADPRSRSQSDVRTVISEPKSRSQSQADSQAETRSRDMQSPAAEHGRASGVHPATAEPVPGVDAVRGRSSTIGYQEVLGVDDSDDSDDDRHDDREATMDYDAVLPVEPTPLLAEAQPAEGFELPASDSVAFPPEFRKSASEVLLAPNTADYLASQEAAFFSLDEDSDEDAAMTMSEPQIGDVLGDYTLKKVIGRGGMGVIYLVEQDKTGDTYALKTLTVGQGDRGKQRRARFQREVEALRRLEHPNIVKVHTCGRKGPFDFYVMEYVKGRELKRVLKKENFTRKQLLDVFIKVCEAVHHANERAVIHRDLKPGNVLLDEHDHVYVLDFGLAKLSDDQAAITRTGSALGTPYYMAPEQLTNPKGVDARGDVWSLGVMLYELMCDGIRPFQGETTGEITSKILGEDPVKPSLHVQGLDPRLDAICLKALEKDLDRRYKDVNALLRDVKRLASGLGVKGTSELDQAKDALRRWFEKQKEGLLMGVFLASLIYVPLLYFVYTFL